MLILWQEDCHIDSQQGVVEQGSSAYELLGYSKLVGYGEVQEG